MPPPEELKEPFDILDCGNAGTGMRLYCGLLSSVDGSFILTGDKYLRNRPMSRVVKPLREIGAKLMVESLETKLLFIFVELSLKLLSMPLLSTLLK